MVSTSVVCVAFRFLRRRSLVVTRFRVLCRSELHYNRTSDPTIQSDSGSDLTSDLILILYLHRTSDPRKITHSYRGIVVQS